MATIAERLKRLQRRLGVSADGILGPETMTRLEALVEQGAGGSPLPVGDGMTVSAVGVDELVHFEISSETNYRRNLTRPIWPGAASGVTIGIGYDLGHTSKADIEKDWRGRIPDADLDRLVMAAGVTGAGARALTANLAAIEVPLEAAKGVFFEATLPRQARLTRRTYPGVEELPGDAQAGLLSLIYNRGTSLSGASRREMAEIKPRVAARDLAGVADRVRAMKRLWDRAKLPGLHRRRDREAALIAGADREYSPEELIWV